MKLDKFNVSGMTCSACSNAVEKAVCKIAGVQNVNVSLLNNKMEVKYDEQKVSVGDIVRAVEKAGYGASMLDNSKQEKKIDNLAGNSEENTVKQRLIVSFIFTIPLFYISMGHMMGWPLPGFFHGYENSITLAFTQLLLTLPVVLVNSKFYRVGFKALKNKSPNMDSLVAVGTGAALLYGVYAIYKIGYGLGIGNKEVVMQYSMDLYFESAGVVLTLITLGKFLEARAKGKTSEAIKKLMDLSPKTAILYKDGQEFEVLVETLTLEDVVIVKPGQSIPVDGVVVEGSCSVDEAMLTGESIPVEKTVNSKVVGGSINKQGIIKVRATALGEDSVLAKIIKLVEDASSSKAPIAKLADKISGIFVPTVIAIAVVATAVWLLLGYNVEFALSIGISVLVISCPCALGLATPTAIMVGTGKGAENGILFKSAEALQALQNVDVVVFDKTGTITEGKTLVTDVFSENGVSQDTVVKIAASLEYGSIHPLADAITGRAKEDSIEILKAENFENIYGMGIRGSIGDKVYCLGNNKLLDYCKISENIFDKKYVELSLEGKTPIYLANEGKVIGLIAVSDIVKENSLEAIKELEKLSIKTYMLTGDNENTALAIGKQVGVSQVIAEVLPEDKELEIRKLQDQGKRVAMVGDGINDAPALTRANVGIAIGAGTDVAIEAADVVLVRNDLLDVVKGLVLSKAVIRNIKENLFWAFIYNIIGIPIAAGVLYFSFNLKLNPMIAGAAMSFSSVCVVLNALRLKTFNWRIKGNNNITEDRKDEDKMEKIFKVNGMMCGHCKARVEKVVGEIQGVEAVEADLDKKQVVVKLSNDIDDNIIVECIVNAGYEVVK